MPILEISFHANARSDCIDNSKACKHSAISRQLVSTRRFLQKAWIFTGSCATDYE